MIKPFYLYGENPDRANFVPVDDWNPSSPAEVLFASCKGSIVIPVTTFLQIMDPDKQDLNIFVTSPKRCYNSEAVRDHISKYLNYFELFYDGEKELVSNLSFIKYKIDTLSGYNTNQFKYDISRFILCPSICNKAIAMVEDNYTLSLDSKKYENAKNPAVVYKDRHTKVLLWVSLLQNMTIPLITHYIYQHKIDNSSEFILDIFNMILELSDINIFNKLYETAASNISRNYSRHERLWLKQDIRGKTVETHAIECVQSVILNIMPKYVFNYNIISFNYASIKLNINYQITGIEYEYDYVPLSSSIRDADNNSVFDKYESYLTKSNAGLAIQNKVACESTMEQLDLLYGPFSDEEIMFYMQRLDTGEGRIINKFQQNLIFQLFASFFGDPYTIKDINKIGYIKLLIASSRILKNSNMFILPYVISSRVEKIQNKKTINKKERAQMENSPYYPAVVAKYPSPAIIDQIFSIIATILSSKFEMIDFYDSEIDGQYLDKERHPEIVCDEVLMYCLMI